MPIQLLPPEETKIISGKPLIFEIKDKNQLNTFYMPYLKHGGLFVPTTSYFSPGSKVLLLLTLLDDKGKKTVTGKCCWITPAQANIAGSTQGVGVAFDDNEGNRALKIQIENALAGILGKSDVRTQTL